MTSNAYFSNEHFKTWIAEQKQSQTKLWVMVHGGHHGTALFNGPGKLTEDIADRFYSWGWEKFKLPSPKLSLQKKIKLKVEERIFYSFHIVYLVIATILTPRPLEKVFMTVLRCIKGSLKS